MRIWIVGGSSGIGLELVKRWLEAGHRVVASARHAESSEALERLQNIHDEMLCRVNIDVSRNIDLADATARAWKAFGGIDLWFYNAGAYRPMPSSEWDAKTFETMNQTNYMGAVRLMTQLLPRFKAQGHGRWVWNASLAAVFGLPYGGGYSAPKAALVNLAESLQPELARDNIQLQIINHGFVKTRLTAKNDFEMPELMTPEFAAGKIVAALETTGRFCIYFPPKLSLFLRLLNLLPYRLSLAMTKKMLT